MGDLTDIPKGISLSRFPACDLGKRMAMDQGESCDLFMSCAATRIHEIGSCHTRSLPGTPWDCHLLWHGTVKLVELVAFGARGSWCLKGSGSDQPVPSCHMLSLWLFFRTSNTMPVKAAFQWKGARKNIAKPRPCERKTASQPDFRVCFQSVSFHWF